MLAFDTANKVDLQQQAFAVTRTSDEGGVPCTRTAWTISPIKEGAVPEDGILRFGTPFALAAKAADGSTLYLQSQRYTITNLNYAGTGGSGAGVVVVSALSADTVWKVAVLDPTELAQFESNGAPVPANTFVSLMHANTATLLSSYKHKYVKNKFNGEYLTSTETQTSIRKGEWGIRNGSAVGNGNHWAFTTASA